MMKIWRVFWSKTSDYVLDGLLSLADFLLQVGDTEDTKQIRDSSEKAGGDVATYHYHSADNEQMEAGAD